MRRDTLGRRIGPNWWRELVTDTLRCADQVWQLEAEAAGNGWATELREFRAVHPRPTLRAFLEGMAGEQAAA